MCPIQEERERGRQLFESQEEGEVHTIKCLKISIFYGMQSNKVNTHGTSTQIKPRLLTYLLDFYFPWNNFVLLGKLKTDE